MIKGKNIKDISIRIIPDDSIKTWRQGFLEAMRYLQPNGSLDKKPFVEEGNSKIGKRNKDFSKVYVWNLPPVATCPSSSKWCTQHCYNADDRHNIFPIDKWAQNWFLVLNHIESVKSCILKKLNESNEKIAFRIHSSGDFFSKEYIKMWAEIIEYSEHVSFWAYTRSWADSKLLNELEGLRTLKNLQLFASWDNTMRDPPKGWRKSIVYELNDDLVDNGLVCPEQSGKLSDCITCKYCIKNGKNDVYFILH